MEHDPAAAAAVGAEDSRCGPDNKDDDFDDNPCTAFVGFGDEDEDVMVDVEEPPPMGEEDAASGSHERKKTDEVDQDEESSDGEDDLTWRCFICFEVLVRPCNLPCGKHVICGYCFDKQVNS